MQNSSIHNTEIKPDQTNGWIKKKSNDRSPVESPISKSTDLIKLFLDVTHSLPHTFPDNNKFPLIVEDSRIASRVREILGRPQTTKSALGGEPYCVLNKPVYQWLEEYEKLIGKEFIEAEYVVGSATTYCAGQPLLREALDIFLQNIPKPSDKLKLFAKISGKISQKTFSFADVDLRIKVNMDYPLDQLKEQIKEFRTDLIDNKVLLIYIGEKENKALDIVIYTELDTESAFNLDDFKINIRKSDLEKNRVVFESIQPWDWWKGQTMGILDDHTKDGYRSFPRLLWQISKSKVSILPTESAIFPIWNQTMNQRLVQCKGQTNKKSALQLQFEKHQENHERHVPIADNLMRLRTQQLIRNAKGSNLALKEAANTEVDKSAPSIIKAIFHVMKEKGSDIAGVHGLIESIALLGLYEAWQRPFEVKLVQHEGQWVMRLRFRGDFGKRDLLVRFDVYASIDVLNSIKAEQWEKLRVIAHSLSLEGMSQRDLGPEYKNKLAKITSPSPPNSAAIGEIKRKFLSIVGKQNIEVPFAQLSPLAALEVDWNIEPEMLLKIGKLVFNHYHLNATLRYQLCWKAVYKCIDARGFTQAAEMVTLLREGHEDPFEGYPALFARAIQRNSDSYLLYQACSPFPQIKEIYWEELSQSKDKISFVVKLMNQMDISAELFLEMIDLLKITNKKFKICEKILYKILLHEKKKACERIVKNDKTTFVSKEYNQVVSQYISDNKGSFDPNWMKDYILSGRFAGTENECNSLCKYLLAKTLIVQEKAEILQTLDIKDQALWQIVANEYMNLGQIWPENYNKEGNLDSQSLVLLHQIIEKADNFAYVNESLQKIKKPLNGTKDCIRELLIVRLLLNWEKKRVDVKILKSLDQSKVSVDWETIIQANTPQEILRKLKNISIRLYSELFKALKPNQEFYASDWVKMVQNASKKITSQQLLAFLEDPLMTECLKINQRVSLPLFKILITSEAEILFTLETLTEPDEEILLQMIEACTHFIDNGSTGEKVLMKYPELAKTIKNNQFKEHLGIIGRKILKHPQGDIEAAVKIQEMTGKLTNLEHLPCKEHLQKLIRLGLSHWVNEMLNQAQPEELQLIGADIYCRLIRSTPELEKRCIILEGCRVFSESIQSHWESIAKNDSLDVYSAARLLAAAPRFRVSDANVQRCALFVLSRISGKTINIEYRVLEYLLDITSKLDVDDAYQLWDALRLSNRIKSVDLWTSGMHILQPNPQAPHYSLLSWVIRNSTGDTSEKLIAFLEKVTQFPVEERVRALIFPFVKRQALNNNKHANSIYWKLDCDRNICFEDIAVLKPSLEQCQVALKRLIDTYKKNGLNKQIFHSLMHVMIALRVYVDDAYIDVLENKPSTVMYLLLFDYIPKAEEDEKLRWASRGAYCMLLEIHRLEHSFEMQQVCQLILDYVVVLSPDEKIQLLEYLVTHKILLDHVWKLITPLACSGDPKQFNSAVMAIKKLDNLEQCPAKIVFQCLQYPNYILEFDSIIGRIQNVERRDYLRGILISALLIETPSKDTALKYTKFLAHTFSYLEKNKKLEINDWITVTYSNQTKVDFFEEKGIFELFFRFMANTFSKTKVSIFFEPEVLTSLLQAIQHFSKNIYLNISISRMITVAALEHGSSETAQQIMSFLLRHSAFDKKPQQFTHAQAIYVNNLLCIISSFLIKYLPSAEYEHIELSKLLITYNEDNAEENKMHRVEAYKAYMILTGRIHGFFPILPDAASYVIKDAIKVLCDSPHTRNLQKAELLLSQGTPKSLFFVPENLRAANNNFIQAFLGNVTKENLSELIPKLFWHLYNNEEGDIFNIKPNEFHNHIMLLFTKWGFQAKRKIHLDHESVQKTRLELIQFNVAEVIKTNIFFVPALIEILTFSIFKNLSKIYKNNPPELQNIVSLLRDGCERWVEETEKKDPRCHQEVTVLLCCKPFIPCEPWAKFFSETKQHHVYEYILMARNYYYELEKCSNDKKEILKLRPDYYKIDLSMTDSYDKELCIRYQWLHASVETFINSEFDDEMRAWMKLIHCELIVCLNICQNTDFLAPVTMDIIHFFEKAIELNARISKINPDFANAWLQTFTQSFDSLLENDIYKWLLNILEQKLQTTITLELIPSLQYIESFSGKLGIEFKDKNCIVALHRLATLGCMDDTIIDRAIENISKLNSKYKYLPRNRSMESKSNILEIVPDEEHFAKFIFMYGLGVFRLINKFKLHRDNELFIKQLSLFNSHTKSTINLIAISNEFSLSTFTTFYEEIELFNDGQVCNEVLELLNPLINIVSFSPNDYDCLAQTMAYYVSIAIFSGPDPTKNTNRHLTELYELSLRTVQEILHNLNGAYAAKFELSSKMIHNGFLLEAHDQNSAFFHMSRPIAVNNLTFRKRYIDVLNEIIQEMNRFIKLRPELKDWYTFYKNKAEAEVNYIYLKVSEQKSVANNNSKFPYSVLDIKKKI
jgi:hypothetical protein